LAAEPAPCGAALPTGLAKWLPLRAQADNLVPGMTIKET